MKPKTMRIVSLLLLLVVCAAIVIATSTRDTFMANPDIANAIESIVKRNNITSICDIGSGTSEWVPILLERVPSLRYVGYESDPLLVKVARTSLSKYKNATVELADPLTATFGACDLVVSRNYLETLSYEDIKQAIARFSQYDCKFFALGSFSDRSANNTNIHTGGQFPINLELHPFNMSPAYAVDEGKSNRSLFVYTFSQIQGYVKSNAFWTSGLT